MRLLIYSQDGRGLGHLRRAVNIAREVIAQREDCNILVLSDSPFAPFFTPFPGMDYLKLPTIVKRGRSSWPAINWAPSTLCLDIELTLKLRAKVILKTFCEFQPDVVVVDHMPVGALGELKPMLERATRGPKRPALYLGLRDVLDAPEVIREAWTALGAYEYLPLYDGVLIYGCEDMYDADEAYDLKSHAQQVVYCNYVGPTSVAVPDGTADEPLVLVMGGGGGDAFALASTFLMALPAVRRAMDLRAIILTGPHMLPAERSALAAQARSHPVLVQSTSDDVATLLRNVSAVISMAGYNSMCEVLDAHRKALIVPRRGPSAEQRMRGQIFSERRLVRVLDPDVLTPEHLSEELLRLLFVEEVPDPASVPPLDGARRAATVIIHGLRAAQEYLQVRSVRPLLANLFLHQVFDLFDLWAALASGLGAM